MSARIDRPAELTIASPTAHARAANDDVAAPPDDARRALARMALQRRRQRLPQVIVAAIGGLAVCGITTLTLRVFNASWVILVAAGLLVGALTLVRRGRVESGVAVLLGTLTAMATALMWIGNGVRDAALLTFPGILIFAGMFGSARLQAALLGLMLAVIGAVVAGDAYGLRLDNLPVGGMLPQMIYVSVILAVTAFCVRLVTDDLRRALTLLEREYRRVLRSRAEIEHMARHDALTKLPNRIFARARFDDAVAASLRSRTRAAAMILDLDHFQTINDSLGHQAGDELLRQAAHRLRELTSPGDVVCRLGGDEFLLLMCSLPGADAAAALATQVLDAIARPYPIAGTEIETTASIGIALCPDDGTGFDDVLKAIDIAMYQAKAIGGNTYRFFDPQMNTGVLEHSALLPKMRAGLARGEFALHYQPQHDLRSGEITGVEALMRWHHPELGDVPPARFIPVAERSGFIVELGAWALREACRHAVAWLPRVPPRFRVSVNVSPVQIRRGDLEHVVRQALAVSGLPSQRLELELTESTLIEDSREHARALGNLRALGVQFAIDDFGTGYSNLAYLKRFEVGRLKIDQSFVHKLTSDSHDAAIVSAIIQMARSLKLTALAEGVEDEDTLRHLRALGCEEGQGWHWSRAMPADALASYMRRCAAPQRVDPMSTAALAF